MTQTGAEPGTVDHSRVVMSQVILPAHAGPGGVWAHGGEIMKLMDTAAGMAALRHAHCPVATLRVEGINFLYPVRVGNYVVVEAKLTFVSASTMEVKVRVTAEDVLHDKTFDAVTSYFLFVALGEDGRTREVPRLKLRTEEEHRLHEQGRMRHELCRIDEHGKALCALE